MSSIDEQLESIRTELNIGKAVSPITVREFLLWFGAQRRGSWVVWWIRRQLEKHGLITEPDFQAAYIDSPIKFRLAPKPEPEKSTDASETKPPSLAADTNTTSPVSVDPTYRISKLAAANKSPVRVTPDSTKKEAVTLMLANDFSQLPVMTSERDVKGLVSWNSIGTRLALGQDGNYVRDLMDNHQEIRFDSSIFQAIPIIVQHQYVLVRGPDNRITGIVTATDLSLQFQQLAEPFLLLGEIENYIRLLLVDRFSADELALAKDASDSERVITTVADLTFGEYIRLIESDDRFSRLNLPVDRKTFCKQLDDVRRIRNDVMHFDPDGIPDDDLERLREFSRFLQRLKAIGAVK